MDLVSFIIYLFIGSLYSSSALEYFKTWSGLVMLTKGELCISMQFAYVYNKNACMQSIDARADQKCVY